MSKYTLVFSNTALRFDNEHFSWFLYSIRTKGNTQGLPVLLYIQPTLAISCHNQCMILAFHRRTQPLLSLVSLLSLLSPLSLLSLLSLVSLLSLLSLIPAIHRRTQFIQQPSSRHCTTLRTQGNAIYLERTLCKIKVKCWNQCSELTYIWSIN